MKVIIVDDEKAAREILAQLLNRYFVELEIVAICNNLESAVDEIKIQKPDLVFLDVEMPKYAGYEIVDFFDEINFNIIFVTAYDKYAIKAFEVAALDYLLKPLEIDQLARAIEKAKQSNLLKSYKEKLETLSTDMKKSEKKYGYIDKGYTVYASINEIIAFEAQRAYTKMYLTNYRTVTISKNIKVVEDELTEITSLIRVHRSWIINESQLKRYSKASYELHLSEGIIAKISRQNKPAFEQLLKEG